jgi:hypothetical protein
LHPSPDDAARTDGQLLESFRTRRDESAFAAWCAATAGWSSASAAACSATSMKPTTPSRSRSWSWCAAPRPSNPGTGGWVLAAQEGGTRLSYRIDLEIVDWVVVLLSYVLSIAALHSRFMRKVLGGLVSYLADRTEEA